MATAPQLVAYAETASWGSSANNRATGSLTWQVGDLLVAVAGDENGQFSVLCQRTPGGRSLPSPARRRARPGTRVARRHGRRSRRRRVPGRRRSPARRPMSGAAVWAVPRVGRDRHRRGVGCVTGHGQDDQPQPGLRQLEDRRRRVRLVRRRRHRVRVDSHGRERPAAHSGRRPQLQQLHRVCRGLGRPGRRRDHLLRAGGHVHGRVVLQTVHRDPGRRRRWAGRHPVRGSPRRSPRS